MDEVKERRDIAEYGYAMYCYGLFAIVISLTFLALLLVPSSAWRRSLVRWAAITLRVTAGTKLTVLGEEKLPRHKPCVLVANHASWLDAPVLTSWLPTNFDFVAGEVFRQQRITGLFLRRTGTEFVRTQKQRVTFGTSGLGKLTDTRSLVVFPEAGLDRDVGLRRFRMGAFLAAAQSGRPIVPVAVVGTRSMLKPGQRFLRRGTVRLVVGDLIEPYGNDWSAAIELRRKAREEILRYCNEPDLTHKE